MLRIYHKLNFKLFINILIFTFIFFVVPKYVFASEYYIYNTGNTGGINVAVGPVDSRAQEWTATTTQYIREIDLTLWGSGTNTGNVDIRFCSGGYVDDDCTGTLVYQWLYVAENLRTTKGYTNIELTEEYEVASSSMWTVTIQYSGSPNVSMYQKSSLGGSLILGDHYFNGSPVVNTDLASRVLVSDIPFAEGDGGVTIFDDPRDYEIGINIPDRKICYLDTACYLKFWYDTTLIGYTVHLVPNIDGQRNTNYSISTTTLEQTLFLEDTLTLPIESTEQTVEYCVYVVSPDPFVTCYTEVQYFKEDYLPDFSEYDIESACDDIPLEDPPTYWSDFAYGIECGFRKFGYWLLTPRSESYNKLEDSMDRIKSSFPFSIYNQVNDTFSNILNATSTSSSIPFFWNGEVLEDVSLLDKDTMTNGLGSAWTIVDNLMCKLIYFACFIYFIYRIFKLAYKR